MTALETLQLIAETKLLELQRYKFKDAGNCDCSETYAECMTVSTFIAE